MIRSLVLVLALAFALAGCGSRPPAGTAAGGGPGPGATASESAGGYGGEYGSGYGSTAAGGGDSGSSGAAPGATAATAGAAEVKVTLSEWGVSLDPAEVPAGPVRFVIANAGSFGHRFTVIVAGADQAGPSTGAGGSGAMDLTLEPGTYTVFCSVGNHRDRGMEASLKVIEAEAGKT